MNYFMVQCDKNIFYIREIIALTLQTISQISKIVNTEDNILGRRHYRTTACWGKQVVGRKHQKPSFCLSLKRKRHMDSHLVSIKVCVKSCADKRMETNSFPFHQHRLKGLNPETMQCWGTIQEYGMILDNFFQNPPNFLSSSFN